MSITDKKGINVTSGFKLISGQPIDARFIVEDETELQTIVTNGAVYEGLHVWVKSLGKEKVWNGTEFTEIQANGGNAVSSEAIVEVDRLPISMEGTVVPTSGLIEKIYLNKKITIDELNSFVSTISLVPNPFGGGNIYVPFIDNNPMSNPFNALIWVYVYGIYSLSLQELDGTQTQIFEYNPDEGTITWNIEQDYIEFNSTNIVNQLAPAFDMQLQNDKLKSLISTTLFKENWNNVNSNVIYKVKEKLSIYPMYWQGRSLVDIANEQSASININITINAFQCIVLNSYPTENIKPIHEYLDDTNSLINFNFYYIDGVLDSYNAEAQPPNWDGYNNTIARVVNIIGTTPSSVQIVDNLSEAIDSTTLYIVKEFTNYADPIYYLLDKNTKNKFQIQEKIVEVNDEDEENSINYISLINTGPKIGELVINNIGIDIIAIPLLEKIPINNSYINISEEEIELIRYNKSTLIRIGDMPYNLSFAYRDTGNNIYYSGINIDTYGKILRICRLIIDDSIETPLTGRKGTYTNYSLPFEKDTTPTENSTNLVTSGGVKTYVDSEIASKITNVLNSSF